MKRIIFIIFLLLISVNYINSSTPNINHPDFAYPKQVISNADKCIQESLKANDSEQLLQALIQYSIAKLSITPDNMPLVINKIDSIIQIEKDVATRCILYSFEAEIFNNFFQENYYLYNNRKQSTSSASSDITKWSYIQMQSKINDLITKSVNSPEITSKVPISKFKKIIKYNKYGELLCPSIFNFLSNRAQSLCKYEVSGKAFKELTKVELKYAGNNIPLIINLKLKEYNSDKTHNDFYKYINLYKQYQKDQFSGLILIDVPTYNLKDSQLKEFYDILLSFKERFPDYPFMKDIQNVINNLIKGNLNLNSKGIYSSGEEIKVNAFVDNFETYKFTLYQIPSVYKKIPAIKDLKKIETIEIESSKKAPYRNDTVEISFPKLSYGRYTIIPSYIYDGKEIHSKDISEFIVSDLQIFEVSTSDSNTQQIFLVNGVTGAPVKNGIIKLLNANKVTSKHKTNSNGIAEINFLNENNSYEIKAEKDNDIFLPSTHLNRKNYERLNNRINKYGQIFTDLGIYHPGDTINFAAICYCIKNQNQELLCNEGFKAELKGKNYNSAINLTSDDYGRISGSFAIPNEILNGNYSIIVKSGNENIAYKDIKIAEYKLPTFFIEFTNSQHRFNENDSILEFKGIAKTYSQVPLINTNIGVNIYQSDWLPYWRGNNEEFIYKTTAATDNNGNFLIRIPIKNLNVNIDRHFYQYRIQASSTSLSGETQSISEYFTIGKYSALKFKHSSNLEISNPIILPVDCESTEDNAPSCRYYIMNNEGITVASDKFVPQQTRIDLSSLPSGKYKLTANIISEKSTSKNDTVDVILYRNDDKACPTSSTLWIPEERIKANSKGEANILFGSDTKSNIYYYLYSDKGIIKQGWIKRNEGLHNFRVKISHDYCTPLTLSMYTVKNYSLHKKNIIIIPASKPQELNVTIESFRDKVMSGSSEKWTLRFSDVNGNAIQAASILDIYNLATEKLNPNYFNFNPIKPNPFSVNIYRNWVSPMRINLSQDIPNNYRFHSIKYPQLNLYGMGIFNREVIRYRTSFVTKQYDSMPQSNDAAGMVESTTEKSSELIEKSLNNVNVRLGETSVALWRPSLLSNKNGILEISFEVPNFNGTWAMKLISYTKDFLTDNTSKEFTSQKPIMVQPNVPQFLRKGDHATVNGLVINATDSTQRCYTKVEIYNIANNDIIISKEYELAIDPKQQKNCAVTFVVPDTVAMLGYRLKSTNLDFSDGEQNIIPVLESISPVIESQPFYINPNQKDFNLGIKEVPSSANITLEYCDNPLWYCITVLPSIFDNSSVTATGLAHTLYAIYTAEGIAKMDGSIQRAIEYWENNPSDSMLVSMLEKNPELKITDISKSPWLNDAQQQTLQMKNISQLYDTEYVSNVKRESINKLQALQNSDGGWSWYKNRESSYFITCNILQVIGRLKDLDFIENEETINNLIANGVKYIDNEVIKMYNLQKNKRDFSIFNYYAFVRSYFPEIKQSATLKIFSDKAVKYFTNKWRRMNIADKAFTAIFLEKNAKHKTAQSIINSIKEFAIETLAKGTYWDNLDYGGYRNYDKVSTTSLILQAINTVNNKDEIIDSVRQWILLQKQANDWGNSSMASDAIYSLLSTGSNWLNKAECSNIILDNDTLKSNKFETYTGYRKYHINKNNAKKLVINRDSSSPTWGSVYFQYSAPMEDIKAEKIDDLSITKTLYKIEGSELKSINEFKVGDKIKVMLTVKSKRNLDFIVIKDERCASIAPMEQLSKYIWNNEVGYFKEVKKSETNFFIDHLPKGTFLISYDATITAPGEYNCGIATIQSEYAPQITAHSAGLKVKITK